MAGFSPSPSCQVRVTWVLLLLLLPVGQCVYNILRVEKSGVHPPAMGHTALLMYVEVHNSGWYPVRSVRVDVDRCCLKVQEHDCLGIPVLGDQLDLLQPSVSKNLTLLYPTMYLYNRVGDCDITVTHDEEYSVQHTFTFNTTVHRRSKWIPRLMASWWYGMSDCSTVDQDPLENCLPVNCLLKYNGQLNYYNASTKLCHRPTPCISDAYQRLPSRAFNRQWNFCKDIGLTLTYRDHSLLAESEDLDTYEAINLLHLFQHVCVHGWERADGTGCDCEEGWTSSFVDHRTYNPRTRIQHMCNVPDHQHRAISKQRALFVVVLTCLTCVLLLGLLLAKLCLRMQTKRQKSGKQTWEMEELMPSEQGEPNRDRLAFYKCARVQIPNKSLLPGELELAIGEILTDLKQTDMAGMWQGRVDDRVGIFPISCAQFYKDEEHMRLALGQ